MSIELAQKVNQYFATQLCAAYIKETITKEEEEVEESYY